MNIADLQKRAKVRHRALLRKRGDPRFVRTMGKLVAAGLLRTNLDIPPYRGRVRLKDALWAGDVEPRILEILPAIILKKPGLFAGADAPPDDLAHVVAQIRRGQATEPFRGIPAEGYRSWVPRIGHKEKLPTLTKSFRFKQTDLVLLRTLASELRVSETAVIRRGLAALARVHEIG